MADGNNGKMKPGKAAASPRRPIRPMFTGLSIAAAWGAVHLPGTVSPTIIGGFGARLLAVAIITGGVIALVMEAIIFLVSKVRRAITSMSISA